MLEGLSERLGKVFKTLRGRGKLSEKDVREAMREVKVALIEADVNLKIAKQFTSDVAECAVGSKVFDSLTPAQQVIDIVNRELIKLIGGYSDDDVPSDSDKIDFGRLDLSGKPPAVIMLCGLQGSGKTTHAAKLAKWLKNSDHRVLLAACDVHRPAAIEQLRIVGASAGAFVYDEQNLSQGGQSGTGDPVAIAVNGIKIARDKGYDVVILDTAGRLHIDETLMGELVRIRDAVTPSEILLVVGSMPGQDAVNVASAFNEKLPLTGAILTKLDGDTRGGAAVSLRSATGIKIKFAGVGEKLSDLEPFRPVSMANRILGMGDVLSLIDKVHQAADENENERLMQKLAVNKLDFNDLLKQYEQIEKMGNLRSIVEMLPGVSGKIKDDQLDERAIPRSRAIICSMTKAERVRPSLIDAKRKRRIAAGSGTEVMHVNQLLKQLDTMQQMVKQFGVGKKGMGGVKGGIRAMQGMQSMQQHSKKAKHKRGK